jgi:hypothetical protein
MEEMKPFFLDDERKEKLHQVLQTWIGTPFRHFAGVKGVGVDCTHLCWKSLIEAGVQYTFLMPKYPKDQHLHSPVSEIYNTLKAVPWLKEIPKSEAKMDGDIMLMVSGQTMAHTAIFCRNGIYHALVSAGVRRTEWQDRLITDKVKCIFRVME